MTLNASCCLTQGHHDAFIFAVNDTEYYYSCMDIFLLIGQSNMAGRGRLVEVAAITHPHVHMFRDGQWQAAAEPLHQDKASAGAGLAMSFAQTMAERYPSMQVGLIPVAVGGTPLSRWMPACDLYQNAVEVARTAVSSADTLRGILWHQGEADSVQHDTATTYAERLREMITMLRHELDAPHVPFVAGELGPFLARRANMSLFETVNTQLHLLETLLPHYAVVSASDLSDNGDNLHFNAPSLRTFGLRYAEVFCKLM